MTKRRPQINFQVDDSMKVLYEEAKFNGHWVARFCAAGLLLMVEDPAARVKALNRLRDWELEYADASVEEVRTFVQNAQDAMQAPAPRSTRGRKARSTKKTSRRG